MPTSLLAKAGHGLAQKSLLMAFAAGLAVTATAMAPCSYAADPVSDLEVRLRPEDVAGTPAYQPAPSRPLPPLNIGDAPERSSGPVYTAPKAVKSKDLPNTAPAKDPNEPLVIILRPTKEQEASTPPVPTAESEPSDSIAVGSVTQHTVVPGAVPTSQANAGYTPPVPPAGASSSRTPVPTAESEPSDSIAIGSVTQHTAKPGSAPTSQASAGYTPPVPPAGASSSRPSASSEPASFSAHPSSPGHYTPPLPPNPERFAPAKGDPGRSLMGNAHREITSGSAFGDTGLIPWDRRPR